MRALRILLRWPFRARRHRRCLRRIALLERELGIAPVLFNWVHTFGPEDFELSPGARWPVNDARDVVFFPAPTNHVEIVKKINWIEDCA